IVEVADQDVALVQAADGVPEDPDAVGVHVPVPRHRRRNGRYLTELLEIGRWPRSGAGRCDRRRGECHGGNNPGYGGCDCHEFGYGHACSLRGWQAARHAPTCTWTRLPRRRGALNPAASPGKVLCGPAARYRTYRSNGDE